MLRPLLLINSVALIWGSSPKSLNRRPGDRIVGGIPLKKHEFPWMLSLQSEGQHFCGGSAFTTEWVVTAAHCVDSMQNFEVVCGAHNLSHPEAEEQRIPPQKVIPHEKWNTTQISNDIAIIRLSRPLNVNTGCQTIGLPSDGLAMNTGSGCMAIGWGLTAKDNIPQKVVLPVVSQEECSKAYSQHTSILRTNICAGGIRGRGICNGDSGSPFNCMVSGKWVLVGLDSFTVPCALRGYPSVFTRISEYNQWIRSKMQ